MAEEAATAEDEEGDIQEDQKLEPSREGESTGALADDDVAADGEGAAPAGNVSGGSDCPEDDGLFEPDEPVLSKDCDEEEAAAELMMSFSAETALDASDLSLLLSQPQNSAAKGA